MLLCYDVCSARLRDTVAAVCQRLCNTIIPWDDIQALVASHLITLDKCPGVKPIGVGETLHWIINKAICVVIRFDPSLECGSEQLCAGLQSRIEGAIHAMNELFNVHQHDSTGWSMLLVDATSAFNSLSRATMLLQVRVLWPRCA